MSFLSKTELEMVGFKSVGKNVLISKYTSIYGAENIRIGNNVRIDDFCVFAASKGFITLNNHIHIAAHTSLFGPGGIIMEDFTGLSSYVAIHSASDDYSGDYLVGPVMDDDCLNIEKKTVVMGKYSVVGAQSVLLPGAILSEGSILGANSTLYRMIPEWKIYAGSPAREIKDRKRGLLAKAALMEGRWK